MAKCVKCGKKTPYHYRDKCLNCKPKESPGRKSYGPRTQHIARLNERQRVNLDDRYEGSLQVMVDELLND